MFTRFALLTALFFSSAAIADTNVAATASAEIVNPLSISQTQSMDFGLFSAPAGTHPLMGVVYGSIDTHGNADNLTYRSGTPRPGSFALNALPNSTITLTCPPFINLTGTGGSTLYTQINCPASSTTDNKGAGQFDVHGSIIMFGGATPGSYSGSYEVTANY